MMVNKEELHDLYWKQGMSISEISRRYGLSKSGAWYLMKNYGILNKGICPKCGKEFSNLLKYALHRKRCLMLDASIIKRLYWGEGLSLRETAKKLGVSKTRLINFMNENNIKIRSSKEMKAYLPFRMRLSISKRKSKIHIPKDEGFWRWLGGFFDGEGSFTIMFRKGEGYHLGKSAKPLVQIAQAEPNAWVIDYIHEKLKCGSVSGREGRKNANPAKALSIQAYSDSIKFARKIMHYLVLKREACKIFLDACKLMINGEHLTEEGIKNLLQLRELMVSRKVERPVFNLG